MYVSIGEVDGRLTKIYKLSSVSCTWTGLFQNMKQHTVLTNVAIS